MAYIIKVRNNVSSLINNVFLFKCVYIILAFISFIPVTRIYLGFLTKLILLWGAYLIINKLMIKRAFNRHSGVIFLCLLIVSYCITIILNFRNDFARNVLDVCYLCTNLLVVYGLDENKKHEDLVNDFRKINFLVILLTGVMSLISVLMFIFLIKYKLTVDGTHWNQGFVYNRLYGIYDSANAAGMIAVISIATTVINLLLNKRYYNKKLRIFYIANIAIQTIYIVLSDSRGAQVGAVSLFIISMLLYFKEKFLTNEVNIFKFTIAIILCMVVSATGIALTAPAKKALAYVPKLASNFVPSIKQRMILNDDYLIPYKDLTSLFTKGAYDKGALLELQNRKATSSSKIASNNNPNSKSKKISIKRTASIEVGRDAYDLTGNRLTIWIAQFKVWERSPIFGAANTMLSDNNKKFDYIKTLTKKDRSELLRSDGNCHNGFLQLLVMGGAVAFLLFACFWILLLKKTLSSLLSRKLGGDIGLILILTFAIVISLLINNISESHIILRNADFVGVITWVYAGYLFHLVNSLKKSTQRDEMIQ